MICNKCQKNINDDAKFCPNCGHKSNEEPRIFEKRSNDYSFQDKNDASIIEWGAANSESYTLIALYFFISIFVSFLVKLFFIKIRNPIYESDYIDCIASTTIIINIVLLVVSCMYMKKIIIGDLKDIRKHIGKFILNVFITFICLILACIVSTLIILAINHLIEINSKNTHDLNIYKNYLNVDKDMLKLTFISSAFFVPIIEELVYRASFFGASKYNSIKVVFISSIVYGLINIGSGVLAGISNHNILIIIIQLINFINYFLINLVLGFAYYKTRNIYVTIIAHIFFNLILLIIILVFLV